jgi:hypothetical protein
MGLDAPEILIETKRINPVCPEYNDRDIPNDFEAREWNIY